ncbi:hypothetical protein C8Q70DRAFT_93157 [Cubamyces menziesii]|nr:hypothetical protein C8Q70DRAFT_93157 [Cubamyces menziesii]
MVRRKSQLDTLLVYAGLFSVVLIASNVESYRLLQSNDADAAVSAVKELSAHLHAIALSDSAGAAARALRTPRDDVALEFRPLTFVVWVNCLWFLSLILSLASASIALLVSLSERYLEVRRNHVPLRPRVIATVRPRYWDHDERLIYPVCTMGILRCVSSGVVWLLARVYKVK